MQYIPRYLEQKFLKMSSTFKAVMVTGARQVGKTTMLRHLAQGQDRSYVTMDRMRDRELARTDPELFFQTYRPPIIIDEVQKVPELFETIKAICDSTDEKGLFWLSGSQSKKFMKRAGDSLAEHLCVLKMYSLSANEAIGLPQDDALDLSYDAIAKRSARRPQNNEDEVFERIWHGGMPATLGMDAEQLDDYFESYVDTYLMHDAFEDNGVANTEGLHRMLCTCATLTGGLLNYSTLATAAGVSVPTAKDWVRILQSMGIVMLFEPYSKGDPKRLIKTPKLYFCDTGLRAHLAMWASGKSLQTGSASGQFFENHAIMELVKHYAYAPTQADLKFFRDKKQREIDLVIEEDGVVHPLEVKMAASPGNDGIKDFPLLDMMGVTRGCGGIVCMCDEPRPIDDLNTFIPVNVF